MDFGYNLKKARNEKGITQNNLAKKIGAYQKDIARWESRERTPSIESLRKICIALNVSADTLLDLEEKEMIKKYEVIKNEREVKTTEITESEIVDGITIEAEWQEPETIKSFEKLEEAIEELKKYKSDYYRIEGNVYAVYQITEFYVQENFYNEDDEWVDGGDVYEFSKWN